MKKKKKLHADDNLAKRYMLRLRKDNLFNSMLGKVYHDVNRDAARFICEVIDKKQRKEDDIIGFMRNLIDVEIAQAHLAQVSHLSTDSYSYLGQSEKARLTLCPTNF